MSQSFFVLINLTFPENVLDNKVWKLQIFLKTRSVVCSSWEKAWRIFLVEFLILSKTFLWQLSTLAASSLGKRRVTLPHIKTVDFDEALSRLGFGIFNYILIFVSGIVITVASFETLAISFVFSGAECDLNLTTEQKGVLSGITSVGIIFGSYLWGFHSDISGRKKVIVPTLFLNFVSSFVSSFAPNYEFLLVFRLLSGFLWVWRI